MTQHITESGAVVEYSFEAGSAFQRNTFIARITRPDGRVNVVYFSPGRRPGSGTPELVEDLTADALPWAEVVTDV